MLLVGLTGGLGSGKSTVARMLEARGAAVFDADILAREAVAPGTPGHALVVEHFGDGILRADGTVDRRALADVVFADPMARRDLEAIVHPEVARLLVEGIQPYRNTDRIVVYDAPLIVESGFHRACDVVVVVAAPVEDQVARVMAARAMTEEEARARIAAQASAEERGTVADILVDNDGTVGALEARVEELWEELRRRAGRP